MKLSSNNKGLKFEKQGAKYLKKKGYKIIDTNFHSKFGEIDIIAQKGEFMVFVEVKGRATAPPATKYTMKSQMADVRGFQYVNKSKINKLIKTAQIYMIEHNYCGLARFDVLSIDNNTVTHIENAFGL